MDLNGGEFGILKKQIHAHGRFYNIIYNLYVQDIVNIVLRKVIAKCINN